MGGACSTYGGEEGCLRDFGGYTCGKEATLRPRRRWKVNIKVGLKEVGWGHGLD